MNVVISESARTALRTLDLDDRRRADSWFDTLRNWENDEFTRNRSQRLEASDPLYVLPASSDLRILFSVDANQIVILDLVRHDTLMKFRSLSQNAG